MTKMKNKQARKNHQKQHTDFVFFTKLHKKTKMEIFAGFSITFELNKIKTCLAPQNDRLIPSFVKDICRWPEKG